MGIAQPQSRQITVVEEKAGSANNDSSPNNTDTDIELAETIKVQSGFTIPAPGDVKRHDEQRMGVDEF